VGADPDRKGSVHGCCQDELETESHLRRVSTTGAPKLKPTHSAPTVEFMVIEWLEIDQAWHPVTTERALDLSSQPNAEISVPRRSVVMRWQKRRCAAKPLRGERLEEGGSATDRDGNKPRAVLATWERERRETMKREYLVAIEARGSANNHMVDHSVPVAIP
jgi:hypothetical protein